jgi:type I restriction enzyme, S subunit
VVSQQAGISNFLRLPPLPPEWKYVELGELLEPNGLSYGIVQPGSQDADGVPILRVKNLQKDRIYTDDVLRVSPEIEQQYIRSRLIGGEVLLSLVGSVGAVAVAPPSLAGWNVARAVAVIRVRGDANKWVGYYLNSDIAQHYMHTWKTTTVQATLNLRDVRRLPIAIPPDPERDAIVALLGSLDDKTAVNDSITSSCHALAQAYLTQAHENLSRRPLAEIATITMGSSPPGETYNENGIGIPFYQGTRDFGERFPSRRVWCTEPARVAPEGAVLVSVRAPVGRVNIAREHCCIGRGIAALESRSCTPSVLFHELSAAAEIWMPYESEGTVFGAINKGQMQGLLIPALDEASAVKLEEILRPLDRRVAAVFGENAALARLRGMLLPALMSGAIRMRGADRIAEDRA